MMLDVVTVVEDAVEQIVIGLTAQVSLAAMDERLNSLSIAGTRKAPTRR